VVDDHGIVESGTHAALVAAGGRYARMYATWAAHS
jgi:ATP-binding cassette, subfamily B, bacterial